MDIDDPISCTVFIFHYLSFYKENRMHQVMTLAGVEPATQVYEAVILN